MPRPAARAGVEALLRLEKVFGRVQSPWLPASGDETYEIIRRRLFQALDSRGRAGARRDRQGVCRPLPPEPGRVPARGEGGALHRTAAAVLPDPSRAVRPAVKGLVEPGEIPAYPRRAALHGERRRRAVAGAGARSADHCRRACRWRMSGCGRACSIRSTRLSPRSSTRKSTATARCRRGWRRTRRAASARRARRRGRRGRCSSAPRRWSGNPTPG